ncbi:MAG: bifunctional 5,10-methylenetetrahydrofolate dehydrogenase/5,10-methenyltetrahydrofolate cyclohydrolase [Solirubrobacterales bacterium]|nr:bifunctional 5,10-methylenetetrahydrofolate dehydrogenase/5,10-methenyltetrahydrofolate cyclohydrolase [Solirubrobacterales bacterium]MCB8970268.1 bifunctional 5,10-methylenetetrahydrofolate dehydrogenase/5,10-methenyltetrahydrofolate cyclohydrolase [Thermoleophilales bacterium]MCO5325447.1 bifunctional 5,10-methylenetetrahydrofolate dehydrogenase/5,10-methenyltetrahydrofolate cyclohydrolase [Solirubrobacterales bacterium]
MTARVIDGKAVAADVRARIAEVVGKRERKPGLATVLVGEDPASHVYVGSKRKACAEAGIRSIHHEVPATISQGELNDLVRGLNADPEVDGILVQLPLPEGLDPDPVLAEISPRKDVDGLTAANAGLLAQGRIGLAEALELEPSEPPLGLIPCTPAGCVELLARVGAELEGAEAVIVGRSNLVGRPLGSLLLGANATVTTCHSRTRDLPAVCRRADILIAAVGVPKLIEADWVKPGATVIDVGMNRTDEGLVGDVDYAAVAQVAGAITPVPGGVGPMTIAMLLANTVRTSVAPASAP